MKDRGHFISSLVKSLIRIGACMMVIFNVQGTSVLKTFAILFLVAEMIGVVEEFADKR